METVRESFRLSRGGSCKSPNSLKYSMHSEARFANGFLVFSGKIEQTCGHRYKEVKPFEISIPASVVSIDGKLYFIPKSFCIFELIPVEAVGNYQVEPEVEYLTPSPP